MPRIRSVKPEFWTDEKLAKRLPRDARLLYIGLWNLADEWGRLRGSGAYIKGQLFPYDDDLTAGDCDKLLDLLAEARKVVRYEVDEDSYMWLPNLERHQRLEAAKVASRLPEPPSDPSPPPFRPDGSARGADKSARDADSVNGRQSSQVNAGTQIRADKSARGAHNLSLLYGTGDMEHGTGDVPDGEPHDDTEPPIPGPRTAAKPRRTSKTDENREDVEAICNALADAIAANGIRRPAITKTWRDDARLMLDKDGRTLPEVLGAIQWAQSHPFWRSNILSIPKLRKQYDRLWLQAQTERGNRQHLAATGTDNRFANARARAAARMQHLEDQ